MFKAGTKTGDYHSNMNSENYEKWVRTQLIPNLPNNSVVIVDNASYHNRLDEAAPSFNARKAVMEAWLHEREISYCQLICQHKEKLKKYFIDTIFSKYGHTVLRLPPYHPDLNPIEMVWATIKGYVAQKNVTWNINHVMLNKSTEVPCVLFPFTTTP